MMRIRVFASGSSGNCLLISDRGTNILIDAGISARRISECLRASKLTIEDIDGVLVTHEHSDHISGLKTLVKRNALQVYAPHTVRTRLIGAIPELETSAAVIPVGEEFRIGELVCRAFHTPHDTEESVGYHVTGSGSFALATDMGQVNDEIVEGLLGAEVALIEANHDEQMLRYGPYPVTLKRRILSAHGHLKNEDCGTLAATLFRNGTRSVVLGHISRHNNTPEKAYSAVAGLNPGFENRIVCAPDFGMLVVDCGVDERL